MTNTRRLLTVLVVALGLLPVASAAGQSEGTEQNPDTEIIGGQRADPGEYPYQVGILQHGIRDRWAAQFCGGSLISPDTVLTAAHCVAGARASEIDVLAGTNLLGPGGGQHVRARQIRRHPHFNNRTIVNDVAVIQLGVSLPYTPVPVALPADVGLYPPGTLATVTGWGDMDPRRDVEFYPRYLREVEVPIVSDADCADAYPSELRPNRMVCAGDMVDGGEDSCFGDSGGPLVVPDGGDWLQVGIVSTGRGCARRAFPGVYTEVASYGSFITPFLDPDSTPGPVRNIRQRRVAHDAVRLSWVDPYFDGGTRVTRYRIELTDLGRSHATRGSRTHLRLRDLPPGQHHVTVTAINALGAGVPRGRNIVV